MKIIGVLLLAVLMAPCSGPSNASERAAPMTEPDPAQVDPILAASWADVKYAFCSAQGMYGVLIDFEGAVLSDGASGHFKMGIRPCDSSQPFAWSGSLPFEVSSIADVIRFDFGSTLLSGSEDNIAADLDRPGNEFGSHGVFGGNSGPCVFLTNKGTRNLFSGATLFACQ